jgi:hypothetical protein
MTYSTETAIGPIIPNMKYTTLIDRDPASSFSNKNEKKYMKAGFVNIWMRKRTHTSGKLSPKTCMKTIATTAGIV